MMPKKSHHAQQDKHALLLDKASKLFVQSIFNNAKASMTEEEKRRVCEELVKAVKAEAEKLNLIKSGK